MKKHEEVYQSIIAFIADQSLQLAPDEYKHLLDELEGHIISLQECWREEHKES